MNQTQKWCANITLKKESCTWEGYAKNDSPVGSDADKLWGMEDDKVGFCTIFYCFQEILSAFLIFARAWDLT